MTTKTTKKVFRQRLRTLARFIRRDPRVQDHLDMNNWECGTTMCAAGWATTIPEFQAQGFKMSDSTDRYPVYELINGGFSGGFFACNEFFGVGKLFMPHSYKGNPKPATVSRRLYKAAKEL